MNRYSNMSMPEIPSSVDQITHSWLWAHFTFKSPADLIDDMVFDYIRSLKWIKVPKIKDLQ